MLHINLVPANETLISNVLKIILTIKHMQGVVRKFYSNNKDILSHILIQVRYTPPFVEDHILQQEEVVLFMAYI